MAERPPRNFRAMREDRVIAMASARFGRSFGSKSAAMSALAELPVTEQYTLKKPVSGTASRVRRPSKFNNELRGGVAVPSGAKLAAASEAAVLRYVRATTGLSAKSKAQALTLMAKFAPTGVSAAAGNALGQLGVTGRAKGPKKADLRRNLAAATGVRPKSNLTNKELKTALAAATSMPRGRAALAVAAFAAAATTLATITGGSSDAMAEQKKQSKSRNRGPSANTVKAKQAEADVAKANADAAKANADAAKSTADTEASKTRVRELELQAEERREKAKADRREEDSSAVNQAIAVAKVAVPVAAGLVYGKVKADKIAAITKDVNKAKAANLSAVASSLTTASDVKDKPGALITDKNKLAAGVKTARKQKLLKGAGPAGLGTAAILVAEGAIARVIAENVENETMKEILTAGGTGLSVAGASVVANRVIQRTAEKASVNAADAMVVRAAEDSIKAQAAAPGVKADAPPPAPEPAKAKDPASKKMIKGMTAANPKGTEAMAEKAAKAAAKKASKTGVAAAVKSAAGKLLTPVAVVAAAAAAASQSAQAGEDGVQQVARAVVAGADALAFGLPGMIDAAGNNRETIAYDPRKAAEIANRASAEKKLKAGGKLTKAEAAAVGSHESAPTSAGQVIAGGAAVVAGSAAARLGWDMMVAAGRAAPKAFITPRMAAGAVLASAGAVMTAVGATAAADGIINPAKADEAPKGDGKIGFQNEATLNAALGAQGKAEKGEGDDFMTPGVVASGTLLGAALGNRMAGGKIMSGRLFPITLAAGAALAAAEIMKGSPAKASEAPAAGAGPAAPNGKIYLNDAAAASAAAVPAVVAPSPRPAAALVTSDGSTEGYTRRGKNGQAVRVKGYSTPKAKR